VVWANAAPAAINPVQAIRSERFIGVLQTGF
jgi:hypothetical protein